MGTSNAMSTSNQFIKYTITVKQNSQSVSNNTSNVTVSVRFYRTNTGYSSYGTGTVYCTINGTKYSSSVSSSQKITSSGIVLFSKTLNIKHNSDGTKTLDCSAYISHQVVTSSSQSYSQKLTTIPRASQFDTINGEHIGGSMYVSVIRNSPSFTHGLWYKVGNSGWQTVVSSGMGLNKTFTINMNMCSQLTSSTSGTLTLLLKTFNGSTQVAPGVQKNVKIKVPPSVVPSCSLSVSDPTGHTNSYGGYLMNLSKVKAVVTGKESYGSAITAYNTTVDGTIYSGSTITSNILKKSGSVTITSKVTDKRGRSGTASTTINVIEYNYPQIKSVATRRCDSYGTPNDKGEYVKVTFSYNVVSLNNKNLVSAKIQYRKTGSSSYTSIDLPNLNNTYIGTDISYIFPADGGSAFDVIVSIGDNFRTVTRQTSVSTAFTIMHFHESGTGLGLGKLSEHRDMLEIGFTTQFYNPVYGNVSGLSTLPRINAYSDLNNYTSPGCYGIYLNSDASAISNTPTNVAGKFEIFTATGDLSSSYIYLRQRYTTYNTDEAVWERDVIRNPSGVWSYGSWYKSMLTPTASKNVYHTQKALWTGNYYMTEGHTATLSETVLTQPHGIVITFSPWIDGQAKDYGWHSYFIPKEHVAKHPGQGMNFHLETTRFGIVASKYLYISNGKITGNADNVVTGTGASGVKFQNNYYVLRAVYGV